ncbi:uncharacterized protein [Centruroides vittatus]|uniref:uncharacterized protein LOC111619469 n=1 Tax=Centruroides sculpturatus TaxID=218467 RepID=UPI000C6EF568|nr:uncharacterized protein LOC111619469 [Centruroides sculpturatus]
MIGEQDITCDSLKVSCIVRSPSHESFATDLSLMSLSSLGSDLGLVKEKSIRNGGEGENLRRSPRMMEGGIGGWASTKGSKIFKGNFLQVPSEYGDKNWHKGHETLFEEESEVIKNCGALSSVLGLMKSFSTSDIVNCSLNESENLRLTVSEIALCSWSRYQLPHGKLEYASRSCSTWVAVGDMNSISQLPSPQTQPGSIGESPAITAAELIRSVNKKVRQLYIKRRVLSTYKALERLTQSQLSLDSASHPTLPNVPQVQISTELDTSIRNEVDIASIGFKGNAKTLTLTVKDIERQRGKPLSKYQRNMMIFNWLQSLDENAFDKLS